MVGACQRILRRIEGEGRLRGYAGEKDTLSREEGRRGGELRESGFEMDGIQ